MQKGSPSVSWHEKILRRDYYCQNYSKNRTTQYAVNFNMVEYELSTPMSFRYHACHWSLIIYIDLVYIQINKSRIYPYGRGRQRCIKVVIFLDSIKRKHHLKVIPVHRWLDIFIIKCLVKIS